MIHAVYDVTGCAADLPAEPLLTAMRATATLLGAAVRGELAERFQPHGLTCVLVLAESHLTVSTWPEHHLAHIDVFTCRADTDPDTAIHPILTALAGNTPTVTARRVPRIAPAATPRPHLSRGEEESAADGQTKRPGHLLIHSPKSR
jgi:S-adenosylmethionine decarboxylase proenzyme